MGLIRIWSFNSKRRISKEFIMTHYVVQWARENNWGGDPDWNEYASLPYYDDYERARDVVEKKREKNPRLYFVDDMRYCATCETWGVHKPGCARIGTKLRG